MRVLFGVTHLGLLRHYQPVLRELIARGHTLHVVCQDATRGLIEKSDLRLITGGVEGVTFGPLPERRPAVLTDFGTWVQLVMDWVRYFVPALMTWSIEDATLNWLNSPTTPSRLVALRLYLKAPVG